jgi:excisionase family DNA binding protein
MNEREKIETEILTIDEVAKKINTSRSSIYKKAKTGIIPHIRMGAVIRFKVTDLEAWINAHKVKACLGTAH